MLPRGSPICPAPRDGAVEKISARRAAGASIRAPGAVFTVLPRAWEEHFAMKTILRSLLLGAGLLLPGAVRPAELPAPASTPAPVSAKEVLRRAITPFVDVFAHTADGPNHAFVLRVRLAESNVHPPELRGSVLGVRLVTAPADKVIFQFAALGTVLTVSRQGQTVWASPASRLVPLLEKVSATPPTAADRKPLASLRMPVPEPLFWVGFYLVGVRDFGRETVGGVACRVLDVDPPDEDSHKSSKDNYMRLFIRPDTYQFVKFERQWHADHNVYVVEEARVLPTLPDSDFQPTAAQRADLLQVPVERFRPLMKAIGDEEDKRRKELREHKQG